MPVGVQSKCRLFHALLAQPYTRTEEEAAAAAAKKVILLSGEGGWTGRRHVYTEREQLVLPCLRTGGEGVVMNETQRSSGQLWADRYNNNTLMAELNQ